MVGGGDAEQWMAASIAPATLDKATTSACPWCERSPCAAMRVTSGTFAALKAVSCKLWPVSAASCRDECSTTQQRPKAAGASPMDACAPRSTSCARTLQRGSGSSAPTSSKAWRVKTGPRPNTSDSSTRFCKRSMSPDTRLDMKGWATEAAKRCSSAERKQDSQRTPDIKRRCSSNGRGRSAELETATFEQGGEAMLRSAASNSSRSASDGRAPLSRKAAKRVAMATTSWLRPPSHAPASDAWSAKSAARPRTMACKVTFQAWPATVGPPPCAMTAPASGTSASATSQGPLALFMAVSVARSRTASGGALPRSSSASRQNPARPRAVTAEVKLTTSAEPEANNREKSASAAGHAPPLARAQALIPAFITAVAEQPAASALATNCKAASHAAALSHAAVAAEYEIALMATVAAAASSSSCKALCQRPRTLERAAL
mmetsp:Transcript_58635/g.163602  ORF Transcript_58635/g.163602 Transcript_58635/m.163602 type:complete len:434 (+) Transcript_58635:183-1484(+)